MIGDAPSNDTSSKPARRSHGADIQARRTSLRQSDPTFSDLKDELANWRDEEKMQRSIDEAKLAAIKLRTWTDKGIYSRLFDRHTNIRTETNWLFFNVEGLSSDAHLETAMSMLIANAMAERASGKSGQPSITVLDECWSLLDSPVLAPEVVQLFRTARKRNSSVWGISQTLRRFRWNSLAATSAWSGHREEREYKADRPTTRRYERTRKPASFKRRIARRHQAIRFAAKGPIRRDVAGHGREIGDNPNCAAGSNPHRLLDMHDISA